MEQLLKSHLQAMISAYSGALGYSGATVCKRVFGSDRFLSRLGNAGVSFTVRTYDRALDWFAANWPDGVEWPADVPRPGVSHLAVVPIHSNPSVSSPDGPQPTSSPAATPADVRDDEPSAGTPFHNHGEVTA